MLQAIISTLYNETHYEYITVLTTKWSREEIFESLNWYQNCNANEHQTPRMLV
jgi:hypothetical protein